MTWSPLNFGKYEGKTLPQVLFNDPDWFFWAVDEGAFSSRPHLQREANDLVYKASHIRIPDPDNDDLVAECNYGQSPLLTGLLKTASQSNVVSVRKCGEEERILYRSLGIEKITADYEFG